MGKIIFNGVDYSGPTSSGVTGVKGNKERSYRIGNVNLTPGDIGALDTDGDSSNTTAEFTEPSSLTELVSGEKHGVSMGKLKLAVKNLIALGKLLGNTDISSIGGGTVTGAINQLNSNLLDVAYPYDKMENVNITGIISKMQNDSYGNKSYIIFIPTVNNHYRNYGVKKIKSLIVQGIAVIRQNEQDSEGYNVIYANQNNQAIYISIRTSENIDLAGYLCDCVFDFEF